MASGYIPPGDGDTTSGHQDPDELGQRALGSGKVTDAEVADDDEPRRRYVPTRRGAVRSRSRALVDR